MDLWGGVFVDWIFCLVGFSLWVRGSCGGGGGGC